MEVIYTGIRQTPEMIAEAALQEDVDVVGLSILSGSHLELVPETIRLLREMDVDAPVVVGGIIPEADQIVLKAAGVAAVYTPKDYRFAQIMADIAELALEHRRNRTKHSTGERGTPMDSP
jgi:(2R)-ethylmalonyl-CoA mutase